jgi:MFS family permease
MKENTQDVEKEPSQDIEIIPSQDIEKNPSPEDEDNDPNYLSTKVLLSLLLALGLSMFMASLDQTVVSVAIPTIAAEFQSLQDVSWVGAAYFLTWTAFQGVYGKCSSIFGYKIMILFALFFFLLGSLLCALANSMIMLIIGRAIAGIGGAGIQSLTQIIITVVCPVRRRGKLHSR